ncbi:MAG TPA: carboxypeptidase-like regulatory domain-containing protein [Pyrinomonadaceae bacterium]|nr:carboxypeptidase-like regulatory domain-containing protein [Pyrinomonadaceae bacterium]
MKILHASILISCALMLLTTMATAQEKYSATIRGRIVDEKGRPVEGVNVTFDNPQALRAEHCGVKNNSVSTDAEGQFLHEEYCTVENRTVFLLMAPRIGFEYSQKPILPPFWTKLRETNPKFAGLKVELLGNQDIDLGDVPLQVWYNRLELFVTDRSGRPFYKSEDDWASFQLIVRDELGNAVGSNSLSIYNLQRNIRIDRGSVSLSLPEGTWTLELLRSLDDFDQNGKTIRYLAKTTIRVNRKDVCAQARLVVR